MVDELLNALEQLGQELHANEIKKVYDQKISSCKQCKRCNKGSHETATTPETRPPASNIQPTVSTSEGREEVIVTPIDPSKIGELLMNEEVYEVRRKIRGTAIIINMNKVKGCDPRTGSEHDTAKLSDLFEKLHFNPVVYEDINKQKTERMLKLELLNQSEIDPDAFILCFMSHGGRFNNKDYICCSDGELLNVDRDICGPLGRCEQLKGKPKIVIIQACWSDPTREADSLPSAVPSDKADMLISFATVPDFPAYREKEGAYFIQTIVKIFSEEAHRFHIVDMLTKVRKEVEEKWQCQLPEDVQRLKKQFYFFPGFIKKTDK